MLNVAAKVKFGEPHQREEIRIVTLEKPTQNSSAESSGKFIFRFLRSVDWQRITDALIAVARLVHILSA